MQISRHWRMNAQRYRLQAVRYENGEVSLQERPLPVVAVRADETRQAVRPVQHEKLGFKIAS